MGWEDSREEGMTTYFSILAWKIPWREEPGELQSMKSQRVGHNRSNLAFKLTQWLAILAHQGLIHLIPHRCFYRAGRTFVYLWLDPFCLGVHPLVSMLSLLLPANGCSHTCSTTWGLQTWWLPGVTALLLDAQVDQSDEFHVTALDLFIHFFPQSSLWRMLVWKLLESITLTPVL